MKVKFKDRKHKNFYNNCIIATESEGNGYKMSMFFVLTVNAKIRNHIGDVYDFDGNIAKYDGLEKPWQDIQTYKLCILAFNLYSGYKENIPFEDISPYWLFNSPDIYYMLEGIKIRFNIDW